VTKTNKLVHGLLAAVLIALPLGGCPEKSDKAPKGKTLSGVATKIDLQTRNVSMTIKGDDGAERELNGTVGDDTEILINGRGSKLADVRVGEKVEVTVQKSATEDGKYNVKKVEITRAGDSDWKPTNATTQSSAAPTPPPVAPTPTPTPTTTPPTPPRAQGEVVPANPPEGEGDVDERKQDLADFIYAQIRVRMEEALTRRADLLKNGTPQSDPAVADLERQILRARSLLSERGEILEDVTPPISGTPAPAPSTPTP